MFQVSTLFFCRWCFCLVLASAAFPILANSAKINTSHSEANTGNSVVGSSASKPAGNETSHQASSHCYAGPNPYQLNLECTLDQGLPAVITKFWSRFPRVEYFAGVGQRRIAYRRFIHPGAKQAIVISSGRTETLDKYQELIFDFYRQGYSVFIYDHRGQGYSDRVLEGKELYLHGHVQDFNDYVEDFNRFVNHIVLPSQHQTYLLFTHSMGGSVAMHYLAEHSDVFAAAAFSAPMARANTRFPLACQLSHVISVFCATCRTPQPKYKSLKQAVKSSGLSHSMSRYKVSRQAYANPKLRLGAATFGWVSQACRSAALIETSAHQIRTPSLVLQAGKDTLVLPEAQNRFCQALPPGLQQECGPHIYPESKHEFFIEQDKHRIPALTRVLDFFKRYSKLSEDDH